MDRYEIGAIYLFAGIVWSAALTATEFSRWWAIAKKSVDDDRGTPITRAAFGSVLFFVIIQNAIVWPISVFVELRRGNDKKEEVQGKARKAKGHKDDPDA